MDVAGYKVSDKCKVTENFVETPEFLSFTRIESRTWHFSEKDAQGPQALSFAFALGLCGILCFRFLRLGGSNAQLFLVKLVTNWPNMSKQMKIVEAVWRFVWWIWIWIIQIFPQQIIVPYGFWALMYWFQEPLHINMEPYTVSPPVNICKVT